MKKLLVGVVAAAAMAFTASAGADTVCTAVGCASVNEGGYVLVADGDAANPDPADGFVSVSAAPQVCSDDNGTADDGDPDTGPESTSPTCNP